MSSQQPLLRPRVDLAGVPAGLIAHARLRVTRRDGQTVARTDRRRRLRYDWVELRTPTPPGYLAPSQLYERTRHAVAAATGTVVRRDADAAFVLDASRRSRTAASRRFGQAADPVAHALARAGVVMLVCGHQDGRLGTWHHWELPPELVPAAVAWQQQRLTSRDEAVRRARQLAERLAHDEPDLADWLATTRWHDNLPVLLAAVTDLLQGARHYGPRAFSQTHFGDSKAHDDIATLLRHAGTSEEAIAGIGVSRAARLGTGGQLTALDRHGNQLVTTGLAGPTLIRIDEIDALHASDAPLAVIENLQAAEAVGDLLGRHVAVLYLAGTFADRTRRLLASAAASATEAIVVCDADLGGVRIAARAADALADGCPTCVVDVGRWAHTPGTRFTAAEQELLRRQVGGPAATVARGCLDRGYAVEQEPVTVQIVAEQLQIPTPDAR
jgi:hypothetical protein